MRGSRLASGSSAGAGPTVAGPVTAFAKVECAIPPKHFTDFLTLVKFEGRWQIVAKVFHYTLAGPAALTPP